MIKQDMRVILLSLIVSVAAAQTPGDSPRPLASPVPSLREQAQIQQRWLRYRLENILPQLMRKHQVAMWLVLSREYNEDPVFFSLVSPTMLAARRRTIYVFFDRGPEKGVERLALGGGSNGGLYTVYRDPATPGREIYGDAQWTLLRKLIDERKPRNIAVNISQTHAFSDGLSAAEREKLEEALGPEWMRRVVRAEHLPLDYLAVRPPGMLPIYRRMMETVHDLLARAFSREAITPGSTSTEDVVWWLRQRVNDLGLGTWFHPTVDVQRPGRATPGILSNEGPVIIERGDVLHVDFGITTMRLNTDTQHMGYVLRDGETEPPEGIRKALANTNRLQDLLMVRMKPGRTGNEVLAGTLNAMRAAGITGSVYTHPIGDHGHGAGALIGLWDRQEGVPGRGDVKLLPHTWYSIELASRTPIPEWSGKELTVAQEEDAVLGEDGKMSWVLRGQTKYHLVR
ncbi:MAG: M24 family metallopeptidase [Bryobacteraceae bacterium]